MSGEDENDIYLELVRKQQMDRQWIDRGNDNSVDGRKLCK